jgi:hypothetical protein
MSVNSAIGLFGGNNAPVSIPIISIDTDYPQNNASGDTVNVLTNYIVPQGSFLLYGFINLLSDGGVNAITNCDALVEIGGVPIQTVEGGNSSSLSTIPFSGVLIVSDGTASLDITITAIIATAGAWDVGISGTNQAKIYLLQIGA